MFLFERVQNRNHLPLDLTELFHRLGQVYLSGNLAIRLSARARI